MTDLEQLQARIPGYADYANADARHQVDKQMRAWLGEALLVARDRLAPAGPLGERVDGLILRCEFSDQRVIRAADHARFDPDLVDRVHVVADRIRAATGPDELAADLDEAARLLDERFGAISDAPSP